MYWLILFLSMASAYLIGSISFAIIITKAKTGKDVRQIGSGNAGSTNTIRALGKKYGILVFILDFVKGAIAVTLPRIVFCAMSFDTYGDTVLILCGLCAVLGHIFPVYYGFKGGKGVAITSGIILAVSPAVLVALVIIWLAVTLITEYVSLGSLTVAVCYPILYFANALIFSRVETNTVFSLIIVLMISAIVIFCHRSNIKRLINKTESKTVLIKKHESHR